MIIDKDNIKILLIILVVGLGLGYAYITSDLNINGTAQVNSANWDVHWANIQVTTGSVSASSPTISNQTTVNYSVILNTPGDYYEFTVDAVNGGTIDAMIDTISSKLNGATITTLPAYLKYNVAYSSGTPLEPNHLLAANTTEKYKIRIEYNADIELNQIPASNQTLSLQFTVTYRQANENAMEVEDYAYMTGVFTTYNHDNSIASYGDAVLTYEDILQFPSPTPFIRFKLVNGLIDRSDVGIVYNGNVYCFKGGGATYNSSTNNYNNDSIYYEYNKAIAIRAFGSSNCSETTDANFEKTFHCEVSGVGTYIIQDGFVSAYRPNTYRPIYCANSREVGYCGNE